jgi:hypothetical protein
MASMAISTGELREERDHLRALEIDPQHRSVV